MNNTYVVNTEQEIDGLFPGQKLETKEEVLRYFSAMYAAILKDPPDDKPLISDDTLRADEAFAIIEAVPGNDGEADSNRLDKLMEGLKVKASQAETSKHARMIGISFGQALPVGFDTVMESGIKAKQERDNLILALAKEIDPFLPRGSNGRINLPIPGTEEITKVKDNNGAEKEHRLEMFDKWKIRQNGLPMSGSVYGDAFAQRREGKAIQETLRQIDDPENAEKSVTHPTGDVTTIAEFKEMSKQTRKSVRGTWVAKFNDGTGRLRDAVSFLMQLQDTPDAIKVALAQVRCQGEPAVKLAGRELVAAGFISKFSNKPITLAETANEMGTQTEGMSVRAFMKLKISYGINDPHNIDPKSVGENATLQQLLDTVETEGGTSKKGAEQTVAAVVAIDNGDISKLEDYVAAVATWVDDNSNWVVVQKASDSNKLPIDMLLSMDTIVDMFGAIVGKNQKKIDAERARINAESERDAAEQRKKLEATG